MSCAATPLPHHKTKYIGGRYPYAKWGKDSEGQRIPVRCYIEDKPDLQGTCLYNHDGSEAERYIMLDIDAHKTHMRWKNEDGVIDWEMVYTSLSDEHQDILQSIEYVTRSASGKGVHILIGISPLPLIDKTFQAQLLARAIQNDLIKIFNEMGLGADEGAKGLKRFFSTYRKAENVLYHNKFLTNRIERSAKKLDGKQEPFLHYIKKACNTSIEKLDLKNGHRLYNHLGFEIKVSRFFLFNVGLYGPDKQNFEEKIESQVSPYNVEFDSVYLSLDEVARIMDTKKRYLYKSFWEKPEIKRLFITEYTTDGLKITINPQLRPVLKRLITRASAIHNLETSDLDIQLMEPYRVEDGMRNSAIVSWAIVLKWHGVEKEEAFKGLIELVKEIPGYENSSSCRMSQIKATVDSVYRHHREKFAIKRFHELPDWLRPRIEEDKPASSPKGGFVIQVTSPIIYTNYENTDWYTVRIRTESGHFGYENTDSLKPSLLGTGKLDRWGRLPVLGNINNLLIGNVTLKTKKKLKSPRQQKKISKQRENNSYTISLSRSILASRSHEAFCRVSKLYEGRPFDLDPDLLTEVKVRFDGYVKCSDKKYYSLGLSYFGAPVEYYLDRSFVYFYFNRRLIEVHERARKSKFKSTKPYHVRDFHDVFEDCHFLLEKAQRVGKGCYHFISAVLASYDGYVDFTLISAVFSLSKKYGLLKVDRACFYALSKGAFSYRFLKSFLENLSLNDDFKDEVQLF